MRLNLKVQRIAVVAVVIALAASPAVAAQTERLSIVGVPLKANEYIGKFAIRTRGVHILAVCHIPHGWHVTAGVFDSIDGDMTGQGGLGVSWVNNKNRDELGDMFLVRVDGYTDAWSGSLPPTYRASVSIGRYGEDLRLKRRVLTKVQLKRTPADRCPPPRE